MPIPGKRGRPFIIEKEDARLYYETLYAVVAASEWPWAQGQAPLALREPPARDDELPNPEHILSLIESLKTKEQRRIKARVRQIRHRRKARPVCVHLDQDAWSRLSSYARKHNFSLSQAVVDLTEADRG